MEIQQFTRPIQFNSVGPDVLAFDLEMANSFRNALPVICMIGTESYDPARKLCVSTIATITRRDQEPDLIHWFLQHLAKFQAAHPHPKLATFSGSDNDIPWIKDRIDRFHIAPEQADPLHRFENLDLRVQFHKRTQNNKISLKKMEELFGIHRESTMSSRKVSYILTEVITGNKLQEIPEKIFGYLGEDVHHLLAILDRWDGHSMESHHFTELEYLEQTLSLLRHSQRLADADPARLPSEQVNSLRGFAGDLESNMNQAIRAESFESFELPPLPSLTGRHAEVERVVKKHRQLQAVELWAAEDHTYRLKPQLHQPKGTLAVVRRKGKVLMIRRAEHIERAPGFWGLPGGVLEKGEIPGEGAVRELKEELNLDGTAVRLMGTSPSMSGRYDLFWVEVAVQDLSPLAPHSDEVAEARWVTPQQFQELDPLIPGATDGFRRFLGTSWAPSKKR